MNNNLFILFLLLIFSLKSKAAFTEGSLIKWRAFTRAGSEQREYKGIELAKLTKLGFEYKALKLKCAIDHRSIPPTKIKLNGQTVTVSYREAMSIDCTLDGVRISIKDVVCVPSSGKKDFDKQFIQFNGLEAEVTVECEADA